MCSQTDDDPGPPLNVNVTGRRAGSTPSRVYATKKKLARGFPSSSFRTIVAARGVGDRLAAHRYRVLRRDDLIARLLLRWRRFFGLVRCRFFTAGGGGRGDRWVALLRKNGGAHEKQQSERFLHLCYLSQLQTVKKLLLLSLIALPALAISPVEVSRGARDYRLKHEREIVAELMELLAIPNLASDTTNIEKNANALVTMLTRRGADARLLRVEGAPPLVYATMPTRGAKTTIAFYAHYDGQPVDPKQWSTPPWQPVLRAPNGSAVELSSHIDPETRLYARSASDDKAPIIAMLAALDALKSVKATP